MPTKTKKAASKTETNNVDPLEEFVTTFVELTRDGSLDAFITKIDDAITKRLESETSGEAKVPTTTKTTERNVPLPTRKSAEKKAAAVKTVEPKVGALYTISGEKYAGVVVKFLRWGHGDPSLGKAGVEVTTEGPGYPKGKKFLIPVVALREKATSRRAGAPSAEPKKTAKKSATKKRASASSKPVAKKSSKKTAKKSK